MGDLSITSPRQARMAHQSLQAFLDDTSLAAKSPVKEYRSFDKAASAVWNRGAARDAGVGHLDNAIRHWEKGVSGDRELTKLLRADRDQLVQDIATHRAWKLSQGAADGVVLLNEGHGFATAVEAPYINGIRAHVADAAKELNGEIQRVRPGPARLAAIGLGIGAATLAVAYLGSRADH